MKVLRQPSLVQVTIGQEQLENYDYLNYLASLTNVMQDIRLKSNPDYHGKSGFEQGGGFFQQTIGQLCLLWTQYGVWESDLLYT